MRWSKPRFLLGKQAYYRYTNPTITFIIGAGNQDRTDITSLEDWSTNHCAIPALEEPVGFEPTINRVAVGAVKPLRYGSYIAPDQELNLVNRPY